MPDTTRGNVALACACSSPARSRRTRSLVQTTTSQSGPEAVVGAHSIVSLERTVKRLLQRLRVDVAGSRAGSSC
jgi:hypothetical protein